MSKLKNPLFGLNVRGTLGRALTFRKRGSETIAEKKPIPEDAKSVAQLSWRHMYQKAVALWHALSSEEKQDWESKARSRHMTGFAWFMSQCLKPNPGIYLPLQGGKMQGNIDMESHRILDLPVPSLDQEAATKKYVDEAAPEVTHHATHETSGADEVDITSLLGEPASLTTHKALTTGIHGLAALHAAGFHTAGQEVSKVIWKDASVRVLADTGRTTTLGWTDLDLTAYTSANAKFAVLKIIAQTTAYTSGYMYILLRKNGTTPAHPIELHYSLNVALVHYFFLYPIIGLDSGQVIEYTISISKVATVGTYIEVLGYIE